jgi:hypothetical protein
MSLLAALIQLPSSSSLLCCSRSSITCEDEVYEKRAVRTLVNMNLDLLDPLDVMNYMV